MATAPASAEPVAVAVMARAPVAGRTKTRLMPLLGAAGAARAHRQLVLRTVQTVRQSGLPAQLWCDPSGEHRFFRALRRVQGCTLLDQPAGDLGQRMQAVFAAAHGPLLLVGSDCPAFDAGHLLSAAQRLRDGDEAVFTPAEDGGYVLVGLRRPQPGLFTAIDWGTDRVMAQTRERLRSLALRHSEMPMLWDVDLPEDWQRFVASPKGPPVPEGPAPGRTQSIRA